MTIRNELIQEKNYYFERYDRQPDLLFLNLKTFEDVLHDPDTDQIKDFQTFYGCEVILVNTLNNNSIFLERTDIEAALEKYKLQRSPLVEILRKLPAHRKTPQNPNMRAVIDDYSLEKVYIEEKIIIAYKHYEESKNLKF